MVADAGRQVGDGATDELRPAWWPLAAVSVALALTSLASNITSTAQLSGEADTLLAVRFTVSKLVNAGVVWAALPVFAGWWVRRRWSAAAAGVLVCLTALGVHYGVGQAFGQFDSSVWSDNLFWFVAAAVMGGPLGLVGATARRTDPLGLLAKLVVPVGAVLEPIGLGSFTPMALLPWPDRVSSSISGVLLLVAGLAGVTAVLRRYLTGRPRHSTRADSEPPTTPATAAPDEGRRC